MYRQPTRWERQIISIETSTQQGKFSTPLYLFSSEYRKLKAMGFTLEEPKEPYNNCQLISVSWRNLTVSFDINDPIFKYCFLLIDELPKVCFADECFMKAFRSNLKNPSEPSFYLMVNGMLRD